MAPKIKRYADGPELREWALGLSAQEKKQLGIEGIEVSNRGRFHSKLVQAFNRAHRQEGIRYVPIGRTQPRTADVFEAADKGDDDTPQVYRQPRKEVAKAPAMEPAMSGAAPGPVMDMLRNSNAPVVVVYVPMAV